MAEVTRISQTIHGVQYIIPAIGHSTNSVKFNSDNDGKDINRIHVSMVNPSNLTEDILKKFQFEEEIVINVDKTYDVRKAEIILENGLIIITVPTQVDRVKEIEVK